MMNEQIKPENIINQEAINEIIELHIGPIQKAELILIMLDLKPATELSIYNWNSPPEEIIDTIKKANLLYKPFESEEDKISTNLAVAKTQQDLDQLTQIDATGTNDEEYGRLMGFPETSRQAFTNGTTLPIDDPRYNSFFGMMLSEDHWEEELELLHTWENAIKQYAPDLFNKLKENN